MIGDIIKKYQIKSNLNRREYMKILMTVDETKRYVRSVAIGVP